MSSRFQSLKATAQGGGGGRGKDNLGEFTSILRSKIPRHVLLLSEAGQRKKGKWGANPAGGGEALALSPQEEGAGQLWTNTHRPTHSHRRPCGARAEAGGALSAWAPRPLLEKNELGKERLTRSVPCSLRAVQQRAGSSRGKRAGAAAVQTCQSALASSLRVCLPGTLSLHVSVWPALSVCSEPLPPRRGFCLPPRGAGLLCHPAPLPRWLLLYGSCGLPAPSACP